jgi:hypothetical protein
MKKLILTILVVLLAAFALSACGVAQEEYDKVVSDLAAAQTQIQNLETQLASLNDEITALEDEYEDLDAEYQSLDTECEGLIADFDTAVDELSTTLTDASPYLNILFELSGPAITGDDLTNPLTKSAVETYVMEADDDILQARYDDWAKAPANRSMAYALFWYVLTQIEEDVFQFMPSVLE